MANEILYSGISGDLRLTEVLSAEWLLALADREILMNHPALVYLGDAGMGPSLTKKASEISWNGADQLAAVAEGASVTNTSLTDTSYTCTVSRYAKMYTPSDLARMTDVQGVFSPQSFIQDAVTSAGMTLTNLIAALGSGFSQQAGATTVNLSVQNVFDASALLDAANADGPRLMILHSRQFNDWLDGLRAETGALHWQPATAAQILSRGRGFRGSYAGIDFFVSNQVPTATAGADRSGMLISRGAVLWADGSYSPDPSVVGFDVAGGKVRVEWDRDGKAAESSVITNKICGVAEGIDLAGVQILSDA